MPKPMRFHDLIRAGPRNSEIANSTLQASAPLRGTSGSAGPTLTARRPPVIDGARSSARLGPGRHKRPQRLTVRYANGSDRRGTRDVPSTIEVASGSDGEDANAETTRISIERGHGGAWPYCARICRAVGSEPAARSDCCHCRAGIRGCTPSVRGTRASSSIHTRA